MKTKHKPTGKSFNIATVNDFFQLVTEDNIDLLLADFKSALVVGINMNAMCKGISETKNIPFKPITMPYFKWIDDGKNEMKRIEIVG